MTTDPDIKSQNPPGGVLAFLGAKPAETCLRSDPVTLDPFKVAVIIQQLNYGYFF